MTQARGPGATPKLVESLTPDAPGFIPLTVIVELARVMLSCFELQRAQLVAAKHCGMVLVQ